MTSTDLADRYGTAPTWRRPALLACAAVVVLAFGGWLAWTTLIQANPSAASGELTFDIVDDRHATARFTLDKDDDVEATCTLKAYAEDHVLVGNVSFKVPPGTSGRIEQDVATDRRATSVELVGCTAPGQNRPR
ncbi:DUF4307 domain-containing protein [Nocardioides sp. GXZ039]|uniref:DUF4307 domain-containing protein n=1 Tax=Nocardioides sp. GXZ039 TaxID=3136018 RepID=UPI0030F484EA